MSAESNYQKMSEIMIHDESPLLRLYQILYCRDEDGNIEPLSNISFSSFAYEDENYDVVRRFCLKTIERQASQFIRKYELSYLTGEPRDAFVQVLVFGLATEAYCFIYPPYGGGKPVTKLEVLNALQLQGIEYGLDELTIDDMVQNQRYMKMACVARGKHPVDGQNGQIITRFKNVLSRNVLKGDTGVLDFKNLDWLTTVYKGTVICEIEEPEDGKEGKSVRGEVIRNSPGRTPFIPMGPNTELSEDGRTLIASIGGQLFFDDDVYYVEECTTIEGDVMLKTGNIETTGDVVVRGNVINGGQVKTTGSIYVEGNVESGLLISGGDIVVRKGMSGSGRGTLRATETIKCKFIENAIIQAGGNIYSECIINSDVRTESSIYVTSGVGVIVGGTVGALKSISAKTAGNEKNKQTTLTIGLPSRYENRLVDLKNKIDDVKELLAKESDGRNSINNKKMLIEMYQGNKNAISGMIKNMPGIDPLVDLSELKDELRRLENAQKMLLSMKEKIEDGVIILETVNPGVVLQISDLERKITAQQTKCRFEKHGAVIRMAMMTED